MLFIVIEQHTLQEFASLEPAQTLLDIRTYTVHKDKMLISYGQKSICSHFAWQRYSVFFLVTAAHCDTFPLFLSQYLAGC